VDNLIDDIRAWHRKRCYYLKQHLRARNGLSAEVRRGLGWSRELSKSERKKMGRQASALIDKLGKDSDWEDMIAMTLVAIKPLEDVEHKCKKRVAKLAAQLPVWKSFGESIRGFGANSLGVIIGEAGDLSNYANPCKLWKRMGLGLVDGIRQGGLPKNASKEEWIKHGYNPCRRSRMWNIGDALIKGNREGKYRTLYLSQKDKYLQRGWSRKHADDAAQRYMEKRLLRHLWQAWRRAIYDVKSIPSVPSANYISERNNLSSQMK